MTEHIPDHVLAAYARDPESHREIEEHLSSCEPCRKMAEIDRALAAGMSHDETWRLEKEITNQSEQHDKLNDRLEAEDIEAERILEPILETPYSLAYANITAKPRFRTGGVVRKLMAAALDQCHKDPKYALALAGTADLISTMLPPNYYPAQTLHNVRGNLLKDFATVYRYLGKFNEAHRALARAQEEFEELTDDGIGMAAVKHAKAGLLHLQQNNAEALPFATEAAEEYAERKQTVSYFETLETIGAIHHDLGDIQKAETIYRSVFDVAETLARPEMKARSAKVLGMIARDGGDLGRASQYFLIALQIYEAMKKDAMVIRMRWSIARLILKAGNARDAAMRLLEVRSALAEKGMDADAAEVDLDRVEAHLVLQEYEDAHSVCASLAATFVQANMLTGALTAAAYLKELAVLRRLTRRDVQHVRQYVAELRKNPELEFAPPPESR